MKLFFQIYVIVTSGGDPVIASTGILVEANTRRFVVDDKKEMYYRAEVQNRVYKRELVEVKKKKSLLTISHLLVYTLLIKRSINHLHRQQEAFRERRHLHVCDLWPWVVTLTLSQGLKGLCH